MHLQSLMIRASAGSGKTYQLANRFLALLAIGVEPSRIIALTFTRKAAGEFADRILHRLADGARTAAGAADLARVIALTLCGDPSDGQPGLLPPGAALPELSQSRFLQLLENLVAAMDRLALGTFDSFFTRIARTSCHELGLGGFALLDEAELAVEKERTFTHIFSRLGGAASARDGFLQAFKLATLGRQEARFVTLLEDFIESHHLRYLAQPDGAAWGGEARLWPDGAAWPAIKDFAAASAALRAASIGITWGHGSWTNGWEKMLDWFDRYHPGQVEKPPAMLIRLLGDLRGVADGTAEFLFYNKPIVVPEPAASLAVALAGGFLVAEIRLCLEQTQGIHAVMKRYEELYGRDVRRRGKLGFSDLTMVLAEADIGGSGFGQNIGYRLDQSFDHWMLDEFQDTNRPQWNVLAGLVQEVQQDDEGKRTLFVVGDPKQGIHAWRGGEPRLFDEIARDWQGRLPEWSMQKSWRSAAAVLELVNQVCDPARPWMRERFPAAALERWKFTRHEAGKMNLRGESLVLEVPLPLAPPEGEVAGNGEAGDGTADTAGAEAAKPVWPAMAAILRAYQPLARGLSCAVLVASNASARAVADYLRQQLPDLPVEVDTETPMAADGPLGAALLDLFRWLHAPADGLAQGHLRYCPMHAALERVLDTEIPHIQWEKARVMLAEHGIGGLLNALAQVIRTEHTLDAFNAQRLEAWQLKARQFDVTGGTTGDWLRQLEAWKLRESSQAGAIQIMTVHKAKGLEFDMVILPDLVGKAFDDAGRNDLLVERGPHGELDFLTLAPALDIVKGEPKLKRLFDAWCADQCYERFCNLYVALTRAKHGVYILLPEAKVTKSKSAPEPKAKYDDWVRAAVTAAPPPARQFAPDGMVLRPLWAEGSDAWLEAYDLQTQDEPGPERPALGPAVPRLRAGTPSGEKLKNGGAARNASRDRRGAMAFGSAVHAAFESIGWLDDDGPLPVPPDPQVQAILERCLAVPAIRALFTRPTGDVLLWREQAFDLVSGADWTSGVMDRIHVRREHGQPVQAVIIDYKTDAIAGVNELEARYAGQMHAYRQAAAAILKIPEANISCVLVSTHLAELWTI